MITTQRATEMNSKVIASADGMMSFAITRAIVKYGNIWRFTYAFFDFFECFVLSVVFLGMSNQTSGLMLPGRRRSGGGTD